MRKHTMNEPWFNVSEDSTSGPYNQHVATRPASYIDDHPAYPVWIQFGYKLEFNDTITC